MKDQQEIQRVVEQTLGSLDNMQPLEANEYLHSKIMQRLNERRKNIPPAYNRLMLRLAVVLILFTGINTVSFYVLKQSAEVANTKKTTGADAFADAYNLDNSTDSY
jgi:hypothetical protein